MEANMRRVTTPSGVRSVSTFDAAVCCTSVQKSIFMTGRRLGFATPVFLTAMMAIYLVMPALAWGSLSGLLAHPARAGVYAFGIIATIAFFFSGCNSASFNWDDRASLWQTLCGLPATHLALALHPLTGRAGGPCAQVDTARGTDYV
jgi:ABC-type dipeptide/oligopeptide/nickel transport system permease component